MRFPKYSGKWLKVSFLSLASVKARIGWQGLRQEEFMDSGDYYLITGTDFIDNRIDFAKCKYISKERFDQDKNIQIQNGDILITKDGSIGKVAFVFNIDKPATLNAGVYVVRITNNAINTRYLFHYLKAPFLLDFASKTSTGGTIKHLNQNVLGEFEVPYSCLDEQVKISNFFDRIDARITTQSKIIDTLQSQMVAIYNQVFKRLKDKQVRLSELCSIQKGTQVNGTELLEKGMYYFMNGGITPSGFYNKYNVEANTISISEGGNSCGYIQFNSERFWSGGHCYTLQNLNNNILCRYLYHFLKAHEKEIMRLRIGTGLPNIQKKDLEQYLIIVPSITEQELLVHFLDIFDIKIVVEKNLLKKYKEQKKFLLSNMFI